MSHTINGTIYHSFHALNENNSPTSWTPNKCLTPTQEN